MRAGKQKFLISDPSCTDISLVAFWNHKQDRVSGYGGMLGKLWDDVAGGSPPDKGMKQLRKSSSGNNARFPDDSKRLADKLTFSHSFSQGRTPLHVLFMQLFDPVVSC